MAQRQPSWEAPKHSSQSKLPELKIYNSLTRSKETFVPVDPDGKKVTWYACGPTVYDDAHLGHARNYVTTDIIRRVMRDYFKFDVRFVMNVTDIDDKIILRGRQRYLLEEFQKKHPTVDEEMLDTARSALAVLREKTKAIADPAKLEKSTKTIMAASKAIEEAKLSDSSNLLLLELEDVLMPYLDSKHGAEITNYEIFNKLAQTFEDRFMEDMRSLNVLDPDDITRVTQYVDKIKLFIEKIEANGFAYETSDGSVYFDITSFEAAGKPYARLEPWNRNDRTLLAEGEGSLTKKTSEKRSDADFALWKASKPGEPRWSSRWGEGRPGWHIECSAMASDTLGEHMDIHSGGIDLAFPHHDNELAQSEAYWSDKMSNAEHLYEKQCVNYFMHMGHLMISGLKMSKSLKNFTTIREALSTRNWSSRGMRIVFLLGSWNDTMEITEDMRKEAASWEEKLNNFFLRVRHTKCSGTETGNLRKALVEAQEKFHAAMLDSFNTKEAIMSISTLITQYYKTGSTKQDTMNCPLVCDIAHWITRMVNILGLNGTFGPESEEIGWDGIGLGLGISEERTLGAISHLRDSLRVEAISSMASGKSLDIGRVFDLCNMSNFEIMNISDLSMEKSVFYGILETFEVDLLHLKESDEKGPISKQVLQLCDRVRDRDLWDQGIYLEDIEGLAALIRKLSREDVAARSEKEAREKQKQQAKEAQEAKAKQRAEQAKIDPAELFKTDEYSEWDDKGVPTKDAAGKDISKGKRKALLKSWEKQKKLHDAYLETAQGQ